jgi:hypothetical protein
MIKLNQKAPRNLEVLLYLKNNNNSNVSAFREESILKTKTNAFATVERAWLVLNLVSFFL